MSKKYTNVTRDWLNTLVWAGAIAIIFRSFLLEPFNIPSGSMIPTMHVGDHIFVTKWSYGYSRFSFPFGSWNIWNGRFMASEPTRGDIIVFRKPGDKVDYVKRLIGLPGDSVQMTAGRLYINGAQVARENPRPYVIANLPKSLRTAGYQTTDATTGKPMIIKENKIYIDNKPADFNYTIEYKSTRDCDIADTYCDTAIRNGHPANLVDRERCRPIFGTEYTEILPNGVRHSIVELGDSERYDTTTVFKVPANHFFMMGDDRDLSGDSRTPDVSYVPRDNLMGRVWFVWYSHNYYSPMMAIWNWGVKIRWERLGMGIN